MLTEAAPSTERAKAYRIHFETGDMLVTEDAALAAKHADLGRMVEEIEGFMAPRDQAPPTTDDC